MKGVEAYQVQPMQTILKGALKGKICSIFAAQTATTTLLLLLGCGYTGVPLSDSVAPDTTGLSNNWELTTTAVSTRSPLAPLSRLSGSILSETGNSSAHRVTMVLKATAGCYANAEVVPFDGSINGTALQARSFGVRGQYLSLSGTLNADGSRMTGTYQIGGGCADGEAGTFQGVRYHAVRGTYLGTFSQGSLNGTVSVTLTQSMDPTGEGSFLLSGSGSISGLSCLQSGTLPLQLSSISGSTVALVLSNTQASSEVLLLNGTTDPDTTAIRVSGMQVVGGNCAGNYGAVTLQRQ